MPRPRSLRTSPPAATLDAPPDGVQTGNVLASSPDVLEEEQLQPRRVRDPAQEQILRSLPNTLSRELKLAALGWRGGCFCCPANISFAQCMAGLWQAARRPADSAEALVHWGLNASKFLFEAGPKGSFGRALLLRSGFAGLVPQLLPLNEEVPQSIALTPQIFFVQIFATGGRQLPLSTSPQLVVLGLLAMATLSPVNLRTALAPPSGPQLLATLLCCLHSSTDDRLRALAFQTLTEWLNICEGDPLVEDVDEDEVGGGQKGGEGGGSGSAASAAAPPPPSLPQDALIDALIDAGLASTVVHVLESSSNAAVLRDACALVLALLAGGVGGGVAGRQGGGPGGGGMGHGPVRIAGMTALELPPGTRLEGRARCRARAALLQAGLVPALLSVLSRRPSQLRYWLAINMGVSGARHLEMQWLMLVIARMSVLPPQRRNDDVSREVAPLSGVEAEPPPPPPLPPPPPSPSPPGASAAASSNGGGSAGSGGGGKGESPTAVAAAGGKQRGRSRNGNAEPSMSCAANSDEEAAERLRLAAAELLLQSPMFSPWLGDRRTSKASASTLAPAPASASAVEGDGVAGEADGTKRTDDVTAVLAAEAEDDMVGSAEALPPLPPSTEAAVAPAADTRVVTMLSRAIAGSALRSCVLPDGTPLESLPPRERNATPDFRALQRDRIRRTAEEARATQARASANAAVDVLSRAMAAL